MANPYRKIPPRSPVTAFSITAYNRMLDMLDWWQTNQARSGGPPLRNLVDWDQTVFKTKNSSGAVVPSYGVVGIKGPRFGPTDNLSEFKNVTPLEAVEPTVADHAGGRWGVMLEICDVSTETRAVYGRCCVSGVVPVRVYVNGVDDGYCDIIEGVADGDYTCYLGTGASGARILWRENEGSGADTVVWAIVRLGEEDKRALLIRGMATAAVEADDATFTIDHVEIMAPVGGAIVDQTPPASETDTVTIYNRPQQTAADNDEIFAEWNQETGHWEWRLETEAVQDLLFYNNSGGYEAPAYGVMAVTGAEAAGSQAEKCIQIGRPSATYIRQYAVNGAAAVASAATGRCREAGYVLALYDSTTGTPANNEIWVPKSGQWSLAKSQTSYSTGPIGWHVVVAGIYDSTNHILIGRIVAAPPLMPYIMYDDLAPGDSDKLAYPVKSDLTADTTAGPNVLVSDGVLKNIRAIGSYSLSGDTTKASRVWCAIGPDGKNHIIACKERARRIRGYLTGEDGLTWGMSSITIDSLQAMDGGVLPGSSITAYNVATFHGFTGPSGGSCIVEWNEYTDHYELVWVEGRSSAPITNLGFSGTTLRKKTTPLIGSFGTETDWMDV